MSEPADLDERRTRAFDAAKANQSGERNPEIDALVEAEWPAFLARNAERALHPPPNTHRMSEKGMPHFPAAEYEACGWMLWASAPDRRDAARRLLPEDFWLPECRRVWQWTGENSGPFDRLEVAIATDVSEETLDRMSQERGFSLRGAARAIREAADRRAMISAAGSMRGAATDRSLSVSDLAEQRAAAIAQLGKPTLRDDLAPSPSLVRALNTLGDPSPDWLIDGMVERTDRIIVTGSEGLGKSTFLRQIAVCAAYGVHPLLKVGWPTPIRVLHMEFERSERIVLGAMQNYMGAALDEIGEHHDTFALDDNLHLEIVPQGINLVTREDQEWLEQVIRANKPDLITAGPIYKMHLGGAADEEGARVVADVLDQMRGLYGVTWMLEAHSPYAQGREARPLRPWGPSLWSRWPEMGVGLREVKEGVKVDLWRPSADLRHWPSLLRKGGKFPFEALSW